MELRGSKAPGMKCRRLTKLAYVICCQKRGSLMGIQECHVEATCLCSYLQGPHKITILLFSDLNGMDGIRLADLHVVDPSDPSPFARLTSDEIPSLIDRITRSPQSYHLHYVDTANI